MSTSEEDPRNGYDLKGSTALIGYLYPVLKAKDGDILDGFHRAEADSSWKSETLEYIDSEEKKLAARLIANFHRRRVSREEKAKWINNLAELYNKQGLKVNPHGSHKPNEIADRIAEVTGLHVQTIRRYLNQDFKNEAQGSGTLGKSLVSAEQAILSRIGSQQQDYGRRLIERLKEDYQEELLKSPIFRAQVLSSLPKNNNSSKAPFIDPDSRSDIGSSDQLPHDVVRDKQGFLVYKKKHGSKYVMKGKKPLPKGEGLPSKEMLNKYYETFIEECPHCLCSKCPHAEDCIERVRPEE